MNPERISAENFLLVLLVCKESDKGSAGNVWTPGADKTVTMEHLWNWDKVDGRDAEGDPTSGAENCTYFEKELWFELGKSMWMKHRSLFQDHVKYIHNDIVNPLRSGILQDAEHISEMHDIAKFLPPPPKKGDEYDQSDWTICEK